MNGPANDPAAPGEGGAEGVANHLWARVRHLSRRVDQMQQAASEHDLDEASQALLDRTRVRLARAVERAELADSLADELADSRRRSAAAAR